MSTKGQPPRGDAALLKAIATGSPVATNGKQEAELAGEWQFNGYTLKRNGIEAARFDMREDIESLERIIASHASLHAYAKADALCASFGEGNKSSEQIEAELRAMGIEPDNYNGWSHMLDSLRTSALAKAEGRQS
jgi:hypothetical protein